MPIVVLRTSTLHRTRQRPPQPPPTAAAAAASRAVSLVSQWKGSCPHSEPRLFFFLLPWYNPYHFHKMGFASGGRAGQTSQDIDMGFLGVTGQGHNPSSSCHGVASCSYEPADRAQRLLRGRHQRVSESLHVTQTPQGTPFFVQQPSHFVQKVAGTVSHAR